MTQYLFHDQKMTASYLTGLSSMEQNTSLHTPYPTQSNPGRTFSWVSDIWREYQQITPIQWYFNLTDSTRTDTISRGDCVFCCVVWSPFLRMLLLDCSEMDLRNGYLNNERICMNITWRDALLVTIYTASILWKYTALYSLPEVFCDLRHDPWPEMYYCGHN